MGENTAPDPDCVDCGGTGTTTDLAPCTTFDGDCACNGPRVEVPRSCLEIQRAPNEPKALESA